MASKKPLVAFFGPTGGCCAAALTFSLKAGYLCSALARTPSKLTDLLLSKGISESVISANLTVTKGDVRDISAVKTTLSPSGQIASIVVSGIGVYELGKVSICTEAASTIVAALKNLKPAQKPTVAVVSTTGLTKGPRDVPLLLFPLYKVILYNPHIDKTGMERVLETEAKAATSGKSDSCIRGFVAVRASALTNGPGGITPVRVGTEPKPAVGYTISREDVGKWIFEEIVDSEQRDRWLGEKVTVTY